MVEKMIENKIVERVKKEDESTEEFVLKFVRDYQPIKHSEIVKSTNLSEGQVAGSLNRLKQKNEVSQLENKRYVIKQESFFDFLVRDLKNILDKYPIPKEVDKDKERYKEVYEYIRKIVE